ncbi:Gag-Pro-Pol polyprotein [Labeo rohita]|uniref:ribonuclease H n=2 Tax=Labeo rohita TaxID=84645 RepID=A0ABQ8LDW0_LABRO|nr:Gag-Pro-Pol polyprotein [Labeo rohita]
MDVLPWRDEKISTRSVQDQQSLKLLEQKTIRIEVDKIQRYATPLLRVKNMPPLCAPKAAVMPQLRSLERRLIKSPDQAAIYQAEIKRLEQAGYIAELQSGEEDPQVSWYIPHHMVEHNGKHRVVFNCSFQFQGNNLNELLLPGPTLTSSLLAVLLRFREHSIAISSDIKGMFHQIRLLPEDRPLLRFLWRDLDMEVKPRVYEWQVLPFGTTSSPCCAVFAMQKHILENSQPGEKVRDAVLKAFYVDNYLQSLPSVDEAKLLVDQLQSVLAEGGFELRQWASNSPTAISHLPAASRSDNAEQWIAKGNSLNHESVLGLQWNCETDTLSYKVRAVECREVTMRNIYKVLSSQYDPLGYIVPYTTRAKVIVQRLWDKKRDWDDPKLPEDLVNEWNRWSKELNDLQHIALPRCYCSAPKDNVSSQRDIHIFCDSSECAYGSVAYLRTEDQNGEVEITFIVARSRVAPKKRLSIPCLELCAALTGAQLAKILQNELTLPIHQVFLWSDSTTVLTWIKSESCRFKVFVGTRITEIQDLTSYCEWRYVDSESNPADDITRGKRLAELGPQSRWNTGPSFLQLPSDQWPVTPPSCAIAGDELRNSTFCGLSNIVPHLSIPDPSKFLTFQELLTATVESLRENGTSISAVDFQQAEMAILQQAQWESFPSEMAQLIAGRQLNTNSRLLSLAPELDPATQLLRIGGRLRRCEDIESGLMHPIVLDPQHPVTTLLIKDYDIKLFHPGPERVLAEMRRKYWILRGREAIRRYQRKDCPVCQKFRKTPQIPRMADLPPARLRLFKPAFYSTGIDCFGPYLVKIGRRSEKRWGILFKCMTTRAVYIDLLPRLDTDSFLMALRRFIARRGKPFEVLCDQGTNFKGGEKELHQTYTELAPELQEQLACQQIIFRFNPPHAPHYGGCWEREIRSLKQALQVTLGTHPIPEETLHTVLIEIEGILNSKPLGYTSSNASDPDSITPNSLLMGRPDSSLPQVIYPQSELLSRRRWRHSQVIADHFWKRFIQFYLPGLQIRGKWQRESPDIKVGTIVMIVDPHFPRARWPIGQVSQVFTGVDNRIRTVEVKVKDKSYVRPVAKVIQLPAIPD